MEPDEVLRLLTELHHRLRSEMRSRWHRSVSFQDELFDRWERAAFLGFGEKTSIYQDSLVIGEVSVGENTWIGPFTVLDGSGGVVIGNNCSISAGVQIYTHDTVGRRLSDGRIPPERQPTHIGDSCYIGPLSIVTKGVTVGHHSVVGACSLVDRNVPPFSVVYGAPAQIRGKVVMDESGIPRIEWKKHETEDLSEALARLEARIEALEAELRAIRQERKEKDYGSTE